MHRDPADRTEQERLERRNAELVEALVLLAQQAPAGAFTLELLLAELRQVQAQLQALQERMSRLRPQFY